MNEQNQERLPVDADEKIRQQLRTQGFFASKEVAADVLKDYESILVGAISQNSITPNFLLNKIVLINERIVEVLKNFIEEAGRENLTRRKSNDR